MNLFAYRDQFILTVQYLGLTGLLLPLAKPLVRARTKENSNFDSSRFLGFWLSMILLLVTIDDVVVTLSFNTIIHVACLILILIVLKIANDENSQSQIRLSPIVILIFWNWFYAASFTYYLSSFALVMLIFYSRSISIEGFRSGVLVGVRLFFWASALRMVLDFQSAVTFGIGNSPLKLFGFDGRFNGILSHPNGLGILCCIYFSLAAKGSRIQNILVLLVLLATGSRTGIVCVTLLFLLQYFKPRNFRLILTAAFASSFLVPFTTRWIVPQANRSWSRSEIWNFSIEDFLKNPLIGNGPKHLANLVNEGYLPIYAAQAHSQVIDFAVSFGIVGLLIYILFMVRCIKTFTSNIVAAKCLLSFLVISTTESPLSGLTVFSLYAGLLSLSEKRL